jgi:hypothetical protein
MLLRVLAEGDEYYDALLSGNHDQVFSLYAAFASLMLPCSTPPRGTSFFHSKTRPSILSCAAATGDHQSSYPNTLGKFQP